MLSCLLGAAGILLIGISAIVYRRHRNRRAAMASQPPVKPGAGRTWMTVTQVLDAYFPVFDSLEKARHYAEQHGKDAQAVYDTWQLTSDRSLQVSKHLRKQIIHFLNNPGYQPDLKFCYKSPNAGDSHGEVIRLDCEWQLFTAFLSKYDLRPVRINWHLRDPIHGIHGIVDLACLGEDDKLDLYFWSRSSHIVTEIDGEQRLQQSSPFHLRAPLDDLPATRYCRYQLRASLLAEMMEVDFTLKVGHLWLVVLHPNLTQAAVLSLERDREHIRKLLNDLR